MVLVILQFEEVSSQEEDEEDAWDPQHATPALNRLHTRRRSSDEKVSLSNGSTQVNLDDAVRPGVDNRRIYPIKFYIGCCCCKEVETYETVLECLSLSRQVHRKGWR